MQRKARAVVCRNLNRPVSVEQISVEGPRRGEVTVQLAACGVCHSDLSAANGTISMSLGFNVSVAHVWTVAVELGRHACLHVRPIICRWRSL